MDSYGTSYSVLCEFLKKITKQRERGEAHGKKKKKKKKKEKGDENWVIEDWGIRIDQTLL